MDGRAPGFVVWLTGLSGAGKTTIGDLVARDLEAAGLLVERLDGDVVRTHLSSELGFTKHDRDLNVSRIAWVASRLTRAGVAVVASAISPYAAAREDARRQIEAYGPFVEVAVVASIEECARRDKPGGLYARALSGLLADFTGVSAPYEPPSTPELRIDTETEEPDESARRVTDYLRRTGILPEPRDRAATP
jgi:adenylylsulfate kinase